MFGHVALAEMDRAAGGRLQARDAAQQRGLAATRGPEQEKQLAGLDEQADPVEGADVSEGFDDRFSADGFHGIVSKPMLSHPGLEASPKADFRMDAQNFQRFSCVARFGT